jgi:hypothetical protein
LGRPEDGGLRAVIVALAVPFAPPFKESPPMSDIGAALAPLARRSSPWSVGSMLLREP